MFESKEYFYLENQNHMVFVNQNHMVFVTIIIKYDLKKKSIYDNTNINPQNGLLSRPIPQSRALLIFLFNKAHEYKVLQVPESLERSNQSFP